MRLGARGTCERLRLEENSSSSEPSGDSAILTASRLLSSSVAVLFKFFEDLDVQIFRRDDKEVNPVCAPLLWIHCLSAR